MCLIVLCKDLAQVIAALSKIIMILLIIVLSKLCKIICYYYIDLYSIHDIGEESTVR